MSARDDPRYTCDYLDPLKRSIANAVQVFFIDGTSTPRVEVEYPVGHRRRRAEGIPLLVEKLGRNLMGKFAPNEVRKILETFRDHAQLEAMRIRDFTGMFVRA